MDFTQYEKRFRAMAVRAGYSGAEIDRCLNYARGLVIRRLPVIYDLEHFATLVGYQREYIDRVVRNQRGFYRRFEIPKRSGDLRVIEEPLPSLKEIQRWMLDNIIAHCPASKYAKAYLAHRSIRDNARFHVRQKLVLALDIRDFFPSIGIGAIQFLFEHMGYTKTVATAFAQICTLRGRLPQGAPTSPYLSNLICSRIDARLGSFAISRGLRYTRYADDMVFSGDFAPGFIISFVRKVVGQYHLNLNDNKSRVMRRSQTQLITGIVVNDHLQVPRKLRRKLRQIAFYIERFGLDDHLSKIEEVRSNYAGHLAGLAHHVLFVKKDDRDARALLEILLRSAY